MIPVARTDGRLLRISGVVGIALAASIVGLVPVSSADTDLFLEEVRTKVKAPLTDTQALELGHVACNAMREGISQGLSFGKARSKADSAVGFAQRDLGLDLTMADGMFLVEAAENQLC